MLLILRYESPLRFLIQSDKLINDLLGFFESMSMILGISGQTDVLGQVRKQLIDEGVIHKIKKDRLNWIEDDIA